MKHTPLPEGWHELPDNTPPAVGDVLFHNGEIDYEVTNLDPDVLLQDEFYPMRDNFGCVHARRKPEQSSC